MLPFLITFLLGLLDLVLFSVNVIVYPLRWLGKTLLQALIASKCFNAVLRVFGWIFFVIGIPITVPMTVAAFIFNRFLLWTKQLDKQ
jgi:hypothetical protein